ncbi:MAG TPA: hypothetical protein VFU74_08225 [Actinocrinis sp.]|nr:hypothetical protein [Actinocrinis sp.]
MDIEIDSRPTVAATVRVARRVPLSELVDRAAEARAEHSGVAFNSSI